MELPNATDSRSVFQNKAEEFNASLPLDVKGNTSFRNRIAMLLSNPASRLLGTPTRRKIEAELQNKLYKIEDGHRGEILDELRKKTGLMDYIYKLRLKHGCGIDVSQYIKTANKFIKKTAEKTINTWDKGGQTSPDGRDVFYELLINPVIYLGELIEISQKDRPIIRTFVREQVGDSFIDVEKTDDFDKLGIKTAISADKDAGKYKMEQRTDLKSLMSSARRFGIQLMRDGKRFGI